MSVLQRKRAPRGKRLNVLPALLSSGGLFSANAQCFSTVGFFAAFLALLHEHASKPVTVIVDNARIHTARASAPYLELLKGQSVTLYLLPAYRLKYGKRLTMKCPE